MSSTFRQKFSKAIIIGFGVGLAFNNCGRVPDQSSIVNRSLESRIEDTQKLYAHALDVTVCGQAKNYSCNLKIYSPRIEDQVMDLAEKCVEVEGGVELCVRGTESRFNTQSLAEKCGGSECIDKIEYSDAQCSLMLPNLLGENPISEPGENLEESLGKVYQACLQVFGFGLQSGASQ